MSGYGYHDASPAGLAAALATWLAAFAVALWVVVLVATDRADRQRREVAAVDAMLDCALLADEWGCP